MGADGRPLPFGPPPGALVPTPYGMAPLYPPTIPPGAPPGALDAGRPGRPPPPPFSMPPPPPPGPGPGLDRPPPPAGAAPVMGSNATWAAGDLGPHSRPPPAWGPPGVPPPFHLPAGPNGWPAPGQGPPGAAPWMGSGPPPTGGSYAAPGWDRPYFGPPHAPYLPQRPPPRSRELYDPNAPRRSSDQQRSGGGQGASRSSSRDLSGSFAALHVDEGASTPSSDRHYT